MNGLDSSGLSRLWSSDDPQKLLKLARDIEAHTGWHAYLSIQEHKVFEYVVQKGGDIWEQFLQGTVACQIERLEPVVAPAATTNGHGSSSPTAQRITSTPQPGASHLSSSVSNSSFVAARNSTTENPGSITSIDPLTIAFRVRYMLFEKSLAVLFPGRDMVLDIDSKVFEADTAVESKPGRRAVDEDYDEDYDDEEENDKPMKLDEEQSDMNYDDQGRPIIKGERILDKKSPEVSCKGSKGIVLPSKARPGGSGGVTSQESSVAKQARQLVLLFVKPSRGPSSWGPAPSSSPLQDRL
jgi:hypothetical protein